jgi:hypothetical protein
VASEDFFAGKKNADEKQKGRSPARPQSRSEIFCGAATFGNYQPQGDFQPQKTPMKIKTRQDCWRAYRHLFSAFYYAYLKYRVKDCF